MRGTGVEGSVVVVGWALRWTLLCCGLVLLGVGLLDRGTALPPDPASPPAGHRTAPSAPPNTIVYAANEHGHVVLDAAVNGAPIRALVDTGASLVALTPQDAQTAGFDLAALVFSGRVQTANGAARIGPVTLREVRIGQFSVYDVPAAVLEKLDVSLLGMSFLSRVQGYEMRDGKLTIMW